MRGGASRVDVRRPAVDDDGVGEAGAVVQRVVVARDVPDVCSFGDIRYVECVARVLRHVHRCVDHVVDAQAAVGQVLDR